MARFDKLPWQPVVSALLIHLAYPPFNLFLLVLVALVPWLIRLKGITDEEKAGKKAFRSGILFGFVFWLGQFFFVAKLAVVWTGSPALAALPYLLGCAIGSLYFGLFGWLAMLAFRSRIPWAVPILWAGVEVFRSYIPALAFPFGLLAGPLIATPALAQSAYYGSVFLTSAWAALVALIVAQLVAGASYRSVRWLGFAALFVLAISVARYGQPEQGEPRRLVAGQPAEDMAFGEQGSLQERIAGKVDAIMAQSLGADLLVLPEGITRGGDSVPPPILFSSDPALPMVFGGQRGTKPTYQSAFGFDGKWSYADKTRLVIFGEYVPGRDWIPFLDKFNLPGGDLVPGEKVQSIPVGKFRVGALLCFEGLFPDVAYRQALDGANVLAVMAIDDWYFGTNAPEQLRDGSNWRAIETGLPVVRAASLGYSIIVDQRGRTVAAAPLAQPYALGATVRVPAKPEPFPLYPVFPLVALASLALVPIADVVRRRRLRV